MPSDNHGVGVQDARAQDQGSPNIARRAVSVACGVVVADAHPDQIDHRIDGALAEIHHGIDGTGGRGVAIAARIRYVPVALPPAGATAEIGGGAVVGWVEG